jgi:ubiquinone/menaquinone biosynthesis C-methylase UbiE
MERVLEPEVMDTPEEAAEYDAMDNATANAAFVERLVELRARGRMLDVGTGPGHIPFLVCERIPGAHVVGIDLSREMLRIAGRRRRRSPHRQRVSFRLADAKRIDCADGEFDAVYSNTILHHIPDPRPFLREVRRACRAGGCILVRDLLRPETPARAAALVQARAPDATPRQKELFTASLCASFTVPELRALADACGLADAEIVQDDEAHVSLQVRPGSGS